MAATRKSEKVAGQINYDSIGKRILLAIIISFVNKLRNNVSANTFKSVAFVEKICQLLSKILLSLYLLETSKPESRIYD